MKFPLYAVKDTLIGFGIPVIRDNDALASRSFEYDCNRDDSPYRVHPEHFALYKIGEYDTANGNIVSCTPEMVANAKQFIEEV